jgi:small-conductance mechanosensitive channel
MLKQRVGIFSALILVTAFLLSGCDSPTSNLTPVPTTIAGTPAAGGTAVPTATQGSPVTLRGKTIFYVRSRSGSLSASERAALISRRLEAIANNPFRNTLTVTLNESEEGTDVLVDQDLILTVTDRDAEPFGVSRNELAQRAAALLQQELLASRQVINVENQARGWIQTLILLGVLLILFWLVNRLYHRLERLINTEFAKRFERESAGETMRYASQPMRLALLFVLRVARIIVWLVLLIVLLPIVLSFFPATRSLYDQIIELIREPLIAIWEGFIQFLPNIFFILVIAFVAWLIIRAERAFFDQIEKGAIHLSGFEAEWAPLTKNLLMVLLVALTLVIVFPYLPFSDAPAFQGITVFLGLLITLSSSSAISNLIAGVLLTYNGAFRVGDLVELGGTLGTVVEKRLFTTSIRTFKNEQVSIPNSVVIAASIRNFSVLAKNSGLILHTEITIGYDAPWRQVHQLLIDAAKATTGIAADPAPFVLQRALNDWHVSYEINAYTREAEIMPRVLSELMSNIQDKFNAAGVEIMSPSFYALRDGNPVTIPAEQRASDYQAPWFRVGIESPRAK